MKTVRVDITAPCNGSLALVNERWIERAADARDEVSDLLLRYIVAEARGLPPSNERWGYGRGENLGYAQLIREKYRGIRPAAGYPACPDHT